MGRSKPAGGLVIAKIPFIGINVIFIQAIRGRFEFEGGVDIAPGWCHGKICDRYLVWYHRALHIDEERRLSALLALIIDNFQG